MVKKKKDKKMRFVLVHYRDKNEVYNFKITTIENSEKIKNELIKEGMKNVRIPLLEYKEKQESEVNNYDINL